MKQFDSRVYSISDFDEWRTNGLLDLSPDFQRRSVWSLKAKSYLVDTILRGKPMPKILITQKMENRRAIRSVVDGQQRVRAILGFIDGDFKISAAHNKELARKTFNDLDSDLQDSFMQYEVGCDVLFDMPYRELLDIFARINTYTVKLNPQELLNAKYVGYFKQTAFGLGFDYAKYLAESKVVSKTQISRMGEASLASDLLISLIGGVQTNKNMENYYKRFEDEEDGIEEAESRFHTIMSYIGEIYPADELAGTIWHKIQLFYTLFTSIAHGVYGLENLNGVPRPTIKEDNLGALRAVLDEISSKFEEFSSIKDKNFVPVEYREFIDFAQRKTSDTGSRVGRTEFVCETLMGQ